MIPDPSDDLLIRKAVLDDYPALCELCRELDEFHVQNLPSHFKRIDGIPRDRSFFFPPPEIPSVTFVAEFNGQVIGFICLVIADTRPIPLLVERKSTLVDSLIVKNELRHLGIGKALMNMAQIWALEHECSDIELTVYDFNRNAQRFYTDIGFDMVSHKMSKPLQRARNSQDNDL